MRIATFRNAIDILIALLLVAVLVWCVLLAWGAYSQHRISLLISASVLAEMQAAIQNQTTGVTPDLAAKNTQEIARLQEAQDKLFDANSMSFIYQFVTLIILTIGTSVLALMYNQYRREQERADKAEKVRVEIVSTLAPFASGQNTSIVVASEYCLLYTLCRLHGATSGPERDSSLVMMADYQNDILRHLEDALREKEGLEPKLHEVILDMAERVKRMLPTIKDAAGGNEKASVERVLVANQKCYDILWNSGEEFRKSYKDYLQKLAGQIPPARKWE